MICSESCLRYQFVTEYTRARHLRCGIQARGSWRYSWSAASHVSSYELVYGIYVYLDIGSWQNIQERDISVVKQWARGLWRCSWSAASHVPSYELVYDIHVYLDIGSWQNIQERDIYVVEYKPQVRDVTRNLEWVMSPHMNQSRHTDISVRDKIYKSETFSLWNTSQRFVTLLVIGSESFLLLWMSHDIHIQIYISSWQNIQKRDICFLVVKHEPEVRDVSHVPSCEWVTYI